MKDYKTEIVDVITRVASDRRMVFKVNTEAMINHAVTARDIKNCAQKMSTPLVSKNEDRFNIDDMPLTRKQYEDAKKLIDTTVGEENRKAYAMRAAYNDKLQEKFKEILKKISFSYHGKNEQLVFDTIFKRAWNEASDEGYLAVKAEFDDLDDFVEEIANAINGK